MRDRLKNVVTQPSYTGRITRLVCPSLCLSVCHVYTSVNGRRSDENIKKMTLI